MGRNREREGADPVLFSWMDQSNPARKSQKGEEEEEEKKEEIIKSFE